MNRENRENEEEENEEEGSCCLNLRSSSVREPRLQSKNQFVDENGFKKKDHIIFIIAHVLLFCFCKKKTKKGKENAEKLLIKINSARMKPVSEITMAVRLSVSVLL